MTTCDLTTNSITGVTWVERYTLICNGTTVSSSSRRLSDDSTDDATDDGDDRAANAYANTNYANVSWSFSENSGCLYEWNNSGSRSDFLNVDSIDAYDIYAVAFTVFFDALAVFSFLPLLPAHRKRPHHGFYAKRMLEFLYDGELNGRHLRNLWKLIASGKIRALVFLTTRVDEPDMFQQIKTTCQTMRHLALFLISAKKEPNTQGLKLIVKLIDEDRRDGKAFKDVQIDSHGVWYFRTELLKIIEDITQGKDEKGQEVDTSWFPNPNPAPSYERPRAGQYLRRYVYDFDHVVSFEVHYMRRAWRPAREKTPLEKLFHFGERGCYMKGDHVVFNVDGRQEECECVQIGDKRRPGKGSCRKRAKVGLR
jgi:hypothetical protein